MNRLLTKFVCTLVLLVSVCALGQNTPGSGNAKRIYRL